MITIPPVERRNESKSLLPLKQQQQIPFPIEEVLWDYQMIGSKDKTQEEREIMLFAVRRRNHQQLSKQSCGRSNICSRYPDCAISVV